MSELSKDQFKIIGYKEENINKIERPTISYWQDAWRRLKKNPIAMMSIVVLGLLVVLIIVGPYIKTTITSP